MQNRTKSPPLRHAGEWCVRQAGDMSKLKAALLLFLFYGGVYGTALSSDNEAISFDAFGQLYLKGKATQKDLIKLLKNKNIYEIEMGIRFSKRECKKLDCKRIYSDIWVNNSTNRYILDYEKLNHPIIKLAIASVLGSNRNGENEYYKYIKDYIELNDEETIEHAIIALGSVGNIGDIKPLIELLKDNNFAHITPAALAVLSIEYEAGKVALNDLKKLKSMKKKQKDTIDSIIKHYKQRPVR